MLLQEKLEALAEIAVPDRIHPLLHVNCKDAWTTRIKSAIKKKQVKPNIRNLTVLARNWEIVLFNYYSKQN
jgi:hypothetical protein